MSTQTTQTTELLFLWRSAAQTRKIKDDLVRKISCEAKAKRQSEKFGSIFGLANLRHPLNQLGENWIR